MVQIYGYNSDLYGNMSEASQMSQGLVAISLMVQIGEPTNMELRLLTSQLQHIVYKAFWVMLFCENIAEPKENLKIRRKKSCSFGIDQFFPALKIFDPNVKSLHTCKWQQLSPSLRSSATNHFFCLLLF
ncbi:hypothetical protein CDAR_227381 [Caerostris darwini]|uniref:Uncharacterized protein n=1 Tax=Caerostris darwini TaxID=1538125 RepID=A0AAV4UM55_9ARAC|nr:hypothetical protein CDAR_227381 [Caerostris darwini]